jgi:hypothetical protein
MAHDQHRLSEPGFAKERPHIIRKKVAKIAMPRGSKPGERRGGRQPGTPNKKTALVNAAFDAATSNADLSPLDFLLGVMRDSSVSPDWRLKAAQAALPHIHSKPVRSPATDPAVSVKQVEGMSEEEVRARDRILLLGLRDFSEGLSGPETEELESLEKAYPSGPIADDPLYPTYQALCQVSAEQEEWIERFRANQKAEMSRDVDGAVGSDILLD